MILSGKKKKKNTLSFEIVSFSDKREDIPFKKSIDSRGEDTFFPDWISSIYSITWMYLFFFAFF